MRWIVLFLTILATNFARQLPNQSHYSLQLQKTQQFSNEQIGHFYANSFLCQSSRGDLSGMIYIASATNFQFFPGKSAQANTYYKCQLDSKLGSYFEIALEIDGFLMIQAKRVHESGIRIRFNAPVDPKWVMDGLKIQSRLKASTFPLEYDLQPKSTSQSYYLRISSAFEPNSIIELKYNDQSFQLAAPGNPNTSLDGKKGALQFLESPEILANDTGEFKLRIYLPEELGESSLKDYLRLEPEIAFQVGDSQYNSRNWYGDSPSPYFVDIAGDFPANTKIQLSILAGLKSQNLELKSDYTYSLKTGDRKSFLRFQRAERVIPNLAKPINFNWCNLKELKLVIHELPRNNLGSYFQFSQEELGSLIAQSPIVVQTNVPLISKQNQIQSSSIQLSDFIERKQTSIYLIRIFSQENELRLLDQHPIQVSPYLALAQLDQKSIHLQVYDLDKLELLDNYQYEIYDRYHQMISKGTANQSNFKIEHERALEAGFVAIHAQGENSYLVLKDRSLMYRFVEPFSFYRSNLFLERTLFRPGENIPGVVQIRNADFTPAVHLPIMIRLVDTKNKTAQQINTKTNQLGLVVFDIETKPEWITGSYRIFAKFAGKESLLERVSIESFLPPRIQLDIKDCTKFVGSDAILKLKGQARFSFGPPAANFKMMLQVNAKNSKAFPDKFSDFFSSLEEATFQERILATLSTQTDEFGNFDVQVPLDQDIPNASLQADLEVKILDEGREVIQFQSFEYYPQSLLVGIKSLQSNVKINEEALFERLFLHMPSSIEVERKYSVEVYRQDWKWSFDVHSNQSRYQEELIEVGSIAELENKNFQWRFSESGDYLIVLTELSSGIQAKLPVFVSGDWDDSLRPLQSMANVELKAEKESYFPGDFMAVKISTPMSGVLHLLLTGDRVYSVKSLEMSGKATEIMIQLPINIPEYLDSVGLKALALRNYQSADSRVFPMRARGVLEIPIVRQERKIPVHVQSTGLLRSQGSQELEIVSEASSESFAFLSIVDRQIHELSRSQFESFEKGMKSPFIHGVKIFDLADELSESALSFPSLSVGGDGDFASEHNRKKNMSPDSLNERVKPQAHFIGPIEMKSGKAIVKFQPKGFQGELEVRALLVNQKASSSTKMTTLIRDEASISPSYPRFLYKQDKVSLPISLHTQRISTQGFGLFIEHNDLVEFIDFDPSVLKAKSSDSLNLTLVAKESGMAEVVLLLKDGEKLVTRNHVRLPILDQLVKNEYSEQGIVRSNKIVSIPKAYRQLSSAQMTLAIDPNPFGLLKPLVKDLIQYPYGCAEQIGSRVFALGGIERIGFQDVPIMSPPILQSMIRAGLTKLAMLKLEDGGFRYFPGSKSRSDVNLYLWYLLKKLSSKIPTGELLKGFESGLHTILNNAKLEDLLRLHAAYLLSQDTTIHSQKFLNFLDEMKSIQGRMQLLLLSAIHAKLGNHKLSDEYWNRSYDASFLDSDSFIYSNSTQELWYEIIAMETGRIPASTIRSRLQNRIRSGESLNTIQKALLINAMLDTVSGFKASTMKAMLKINDAAAIELDSQYQETIQLPSIPQTAFALEVSQGIASYSMQIWGNGTHPIYQEQEELQLQQLVTTANSFELGEQIHLTHEISAKNKQNLVMVVQIPACFEIVNQRLLNQELDAPGMEVEYLDYRDDRVLVFGAVNKNAKVHIPVQITQKGDCHWPHSYVLDMYETGLVDYNRFQERVLIKE